MPKSLHQRHRPHGLSRLEFLIALSVVAVLMSVLLSRLSELPGLSRPARLQATMAQVRAAAQLFHARCAALRQQRADETCETVTVDGVVLQGAQGWPAATAQGIARAASLPSPGRVRFDALRLRTGERHGRPALFVALAERGCEFSYVQASSPDTSPEVDVVDASCQ